VVATTTQVADFARNVGGTAITLTQLLKPNVDPHDYEASPADVQAIAGADVVVKSGVGLEKFLDRWGVKVGDDIVMDTSGAGRLYDAGPAMPLVKDYDGRQPITRSFRLMTFWPLVRSAAPKENAGDASPLPLAQTGRDSFAEPYSGPPRRQRFDPSRDRKGPIVVASAVTRAARECREARLVVLGSSNLATNSFFPREGNGDFLMNCINWLAQEEELIAIRPRSPQDHRIQMTEEQARGLFWLVVVALPRAALAAGIAVHWRRR